MTIAQPEAHLDDRFSSPGAEPVSWADAARTLAEAGVYWMSTMHPSGQPHVTPVAGIWFEHSFYFATGPGEQKARNLARNPRCTVTIGRSDFRVGVDVVLEGEVERVAEPVRLHTLATEFNRKYEDFFGFAVEDGFFRNVTGGIALVYRLNATRGFGFARGEYFSQTRWDIAPPD